MGFFKNLFGGKDEQLRPDFDATLAINFEKILNRISIISSSYYSFKDIEKGSFKFLVVGLGDYDGLNFEGYFCFPLDYKHLNKKDNKSKLILSRDSYVQSFDFPEIIEVQIEDLDLEKYFGVRQIKKVHEFIRDVFRDLKKD